MEMDDPIDQENGSTDGPFLQQAPKDEVSDINRRCPPEWKCTPGFNGTTWCTKPRHIKIVLVLVACCVVALIVITTAIETISPPTDTSPYEQPKEKNNSCIYHDISKKSNDTLGHRCVLGSPFVKGYCKPVEGVQKCDYCEKHDILPLLPKYCFCDKSDDCHGADSSGKKTCTECLAVNYCPCLNGGSCECANDTNLTGKDIRCNCTEGYDGDYCGIIPNRECVRNKTVSHLNHCKGSQDPECFIRDSAQNSTLRCEILTDEEEIAELEKCCEQ